MARRAFTLIELLIVIVIVVLLISILLPAIARAREAGRAVVCASNLRQMGMALGVYGNDNKTYTTGEHWEPGLRDSVHMWMTRLRKVTGTTQAFYCPSYPRDYRWSPFDPASPWQTDPRVYRHPWSKYVGYEEEEPIITGENQLMCYAYNGWGIQDYTDPNYGLGGHIRYPKEFIRDTGQAQDTRELPFGEVPEHRVQFPSAMVAIADSDGDGQRDCRLSCSAQGRFQRPGPIHYRRRAEVKSPQALLETRLIGRCNVLWADTHAGPSKYTDLIVENLANKKADPAAWRIIEQWNNDHKPHVEEW